VDALARSLADIDLPHPVPVDLSRRAIADSDPGSARHTSRPTWPEEDLLLLSDPQTSGGLLVAGEVPGFTVIGEFVVTRGPTIVVR
jgi:hypothetical protein